MQEYDHQEQIGSDIVPASQYHVVWFVMMPAEALWIECAAMVADRQFGNSVCHFASQTGS